MRKIVFSLFLFSIVFYSSKGQTQADFISDTVCFGTKTSLQQDAIINPSTNNIIAYNWDLDNDGQFDDGSGAAITKIFDSFKVYTVGLQAISDIPDTSVIYKKVYLRAKPEARIYQPYPTTQCLNLNAFDFYDTSVIASGKIVGYAWDLDNATQSTNKNELGVVYFSKGARNIVHAVVSDFNCWDSVSYTVIVIDSSRADFLIDDPTKCSSSGDFTFTNNSITCGAVQELSWDFNNDGIFGDSIGKGTVTVNYSTLGSHSVGLRIITTTGRDSIYKVINVLESTVPDFTINDATQCERGNSFDFVNNSTLSAGSFTSFWDLGDGDTISSNGVTGKNYNTYGTLTVKLVTTNTAGCIDSVKKTIDIYPNPNVSFTANKTSVCQVDSFIFTNTSTIASPWTMTYSWVFGDGSTLNGKTDASRQYAAPGSYDVILYATQDSACFDSMVMTVNVISKSIADFAINDSAQCLNGNLFTFTNSSTNCSPIDSILWDFDNDGNYDDDTGAVTSYSFTTEGTYPIGLMVKTTTDTSYITKNVYVYPQPIASFTVNDTLQDLIGNSFIFTSTSTLSSGTHNYSWFLGDGYVYGSAPSMNKSYGSTGTYTVILYDTSDMGCADTAFKLVYVVAPVNAGFRSTSVCFGDSNLLTDTSVSKSAILQYNWDLDNDGVFNDATGKQLKYLFPYADTFMVGLQVVTATDKDTAYNNVTVHPMPSAGFNFTSACLGTSTTFTDNSNVKGDYISKYYWDFDGNGTIEDSSGQITSYKYAAGGLFVAKLTVKTSNGCTDEASSNVNVNQAPVAGFTFSNACVGDSVLFANTSSIAAPDSIINYLWSYGDGIDAIIRDDHTHFYTTGGSYNVRLVVLSDKGCKDTLNQSITIHPKPLPSITNSDDTIFYKGSSIDLTVNGSYNSVLWSTQATSYTINVTETGVYIVTVTDANNCTNSASIQVIVNEVPEIEAVDVFTPNGDGVNDRFVVKNLAAFQPMVLTVFNRWGDEIYSSTDYQNNWDGTYDNKILAEGTYYYIIKTKDGTVLKGTVSIIK